MMLSAYSWDLVTVLFQNIFCLLAFGDALSYLLTEFITYGTVLSRWCKGDIGTSLGFFRIVPQYPREDES